MENWWIFILVGLCCGIFGSSFGIGGGTILVPALVIFFSFSQKSAQGTSLAVIVFMALMGAYRYYQNPAIEIDLTVVLFLAIGAIGGAVIGSKIAASIPGPLLRKYFAVFLFIAALKMLFFSPAQKTLPPEEPVLNSHETTGES